MTAESRRMKRIFDGTTRLLNQNTKQPGDFLMAAHLLIGQAVLALVIDCEGDKARIRDAACDALNQHLAKL